VKSIHAVVFELDGTLANTAHLDIDDHTPAKLLAAAPPNSQGASPWVNGRSSTPGSFLAAGYRVAIITRSPRMYAWTLVWLLGVDFEVLIPGGFAPPGQPGQASSSPKHKLAYLARRWGLRPEQVLYIGDTDEDRACAGHVGTRYERGAWLDGIAGRIPRRRNPIPSEVTRVRLSDGAGTTAQTALVDAAVERLRNGSATDSDYQLLIAREYHSALVTYGDAARLPDDLAEIRMSTSGPPWSDSTDDATWSDLVRTGDIGRVLDMQQGFVMFRVPDAELDASLAREAASGAYGVVEDTLSSLEPLLARRIALPPRPLVPRKRLLYELRELGDEEATIHEIAVSPMITHADRLRIALGVLAHEPGHPARRELQRIVLTHLPAAAGECLVQQPWDAWWLQQPVQVPRWLVTRAEYETDPELTGLVATRLRDWFPLHQVSETMSHACVSYSHSGKGLGSELWRWVKDWRGTTSGPSVGMEFLELPALVLASHVRVGILDAVVPVPSTPFDVWHPAQASERLGHRVAALSGVPVVPALTKTDAGAFVVNTHAELVRGRRVALVDDQATQGGTFFACRRALREAGVDDITSLSWSNSGLPRAWVQTHYTEGCWLAGLKLPDMAGRLVCQANPVTLAVTGHPR
jgi:hypothetical protein